LLSHVRSFHSYAKCDICGQEMPRMRLPRHMSSKHTNVVLQSQESPFAFFARIKCSKCDKVIASRQMEKHERTFHREINCGQCNRMVVGERALRLHLKEAHMRKISAAEIANAAEDAGQHVTTKQRSRIYKRFDKFHCVYDGCHFRCDKRQKLRDHHVQYHPERVPQEELRKRARFLRKANQNLVAASAQPPRPVPKVRGGHQLHFDTVQTEDVSSSTDDAFSGGSNDQEGGDEKGDSNSESSATASQNPTPKRVKIMKEPTAAKVETQGDVMKYMKASFEAWPMTPASALRHAVKKEEYSMAPPEELEDFAKRHAISGGAVTPSSCKTSATMTSGSLHRRDHYYMAGNTGPRQSTPAVYIHDFSLPSAPNVIAANSPPIVGAPALVMARTAYDHTLEDSVYYQYTVAESDLALAGAEEVVVAEQPSLDGVQYIKLEEAFKVQVDVQDNVPSPFSV